MPASLRCLATDPGLVPRWMTETKHENEMEMPLLVISQICFAELLKIYKFSVQFYFLVFSVIGRDKYDQNPNKVTENILGNVLKKQKGLTL